MASNTKSEFESKIENFWKWFDANSARLLKYSTDKHVGDEITRQLEELGIGDWEIGPWEEGLFFFAISPNLNEDKLKKTKEIVAQAPVCQGWHFLSSKPPKKWKGIWKMNNEYGQEILINSSNWQYILYRFEDDTFDADIVLADIKGNEEIQNLAVDIALTGYLGEESFMNLIKNIKIVNKFDMQSESKASFLKYINKHIESVL